MFNFNRIFKKSRSKNTVEEDSNDSNMRKAIRANDDEENTDTFINTGVLGGLVVIFLIALIVVIIVVKNKKKDASDYYDNVEGGSQISSFISDVSSAVSVPDVVSVFASY